MTNQATTLFTVAVGRTGQSFTYDWSELPESTRAHVIQYGFNQIHQDAVASATEKKFPVESDRRAECERLSTARDLALRTGNVGAKAGVVATLAAEILKLKAELAAAQAVAVETPRKRA